MQLEDAKQVERLCRHVESLRPSWRVSYVDAADEQVMITVWGARGAILDGPLSCSLASIRSDFWGAGREIVRKVERLAAAASR